MGNDMVRIQLNCCYVTVFYKNGEWWGKGLQILNSVPRRLFILNSTGWSNKNIVASSKQNLRGLHE